MAVSGTVFDMINAVHHEKPLIFIGALDNGTRVYRTENVLSLIWLFLALYLT